MPDGPAREPLKRFGNVQRAPRYAQMVRLEGNGTELVIIPCTRVPEGRARSQAVPWAEALFRFLRSGLAQDASNKETQRKAPLCLNNVK